MGDAIHVNVGALQHAAAADGRRVRTGTPDIEWTAADWALFPGIPHVTIDQGFINSPVPSAIVRDVEPGAWTPFNAVEPRRVDGGAADDLLRPQRPVT